MGITAHRGAADTAPAAGSPPAAGEPLLGIGAAAAQAGVSERALRYYQQLGLLVPACTPGGIRQYPKNKLARIARTH
ncbi:MAG: MerR family DNA-binding transcriptional regulator, partial [Streptosporangiaceae bacterium]